MNTKKIGILDLKADEDAFIEKVIEFLRYDPTELELMKNFLLFYFELLIIGEVENIVFSEQTIAELTIIRNKCMWQRGKGISLIPHIGIDEKEKIMTIHSTELLEHLSSFIRYEVSVAPMRFIREYTSFSSPIPLAVESTECLTPFASVDTTYK